MATPSPHKVAGLLLASLVVQLAASVSMVEPASAIGPMVVPAAPHPGAIAPRNSTRAHQGGFRSGRAVHNYGGAVRVKGRKAAPSKRVVRKPAAPPPPPQNFVNDLSIETIAPGVIHKVHRSAMYINVLDIDLRNPNIQVKPVMAGESFNRLDEVKDQAQRVQAIAAINGNYFKRDGTPLGTLIMDGEWVSGPIFDRTCFGITDDGKVLVDPVTLHGTLETSNTEVPSIWVNNINQPRRKGTKLIAYTRRWGAAVQMAYDGALVAVDSSGRVIDKAPRVIGIPYGGFVLSDTKSSPISKLNVGDLVNLSWHPGPNEWKRVVQAVSGGPVLIRDGKLYVGLKDENFRKSWTGSQIHARTAIGVTANHHLILATIEGPHTLWDVAKFLKKMGAVDALNLDGGGSTTMVINGATVTRNRSTFERRVASSLVVVPRTPGEPLYRGTNAAYVPGSNLTDFSAAPLVKTAPGPGFEISPEKPVVTQQTAPTLEPMYEEPNPEHEALQTADLPKPGRMKKYFGWMKHLNPLK